MFLRYKENQWSLVGSVIEDVSTNFGYSVDCNKQGNILSIGNSTEIKTYYFDLVAENWTLFGEIVQGNNAKLNDIGTTLLIGSTEYDSTSSSLINNGKISEYNLNKTQKQFNKIKVRKDNYQSISVASEKRLQFTEIQIWINNENICQNSNYTKTLTSTTILEGTTERVVDNDVYDDNTNWFSSNSASVGADAYWQIEFTNTKFNYNDIQSIVIYTSTYHENATNRMKHSIIDIYNDDELITSTQKLTESKDYLRFDGLAINSVSNFSSNASSENIIDSGNNTLIQNLEVIIVSSSSQTQT